MAQGTTMGCPSYILCREDASRTDCCIWKPRQLYTNGRTASSSPISVFCRLTSQVPNPVCLNDFLMLLSRPTSSQRSMTKDILHHHNPSPSGMILMPVLKQNQEKRHPNAFIVQLSSPYRLQNSCFNNVKDRPSGRWEMTHTAPQNIPRLGTTTSSEPSALEYPDAQHESSYRHDMSEQTHPAIKERMTTTRQFINLQNQRFQPTFL